MARAYVENEAGNRIRIADSLGAVVRIARRKNNSDAQNRRRVEEGSGILWREEEDVD